MDYGKLSKKEEGGESVEKIHTLYFFFEGFPYDPPNFARLTNFDSL